MMQLAGFQDAGRFNRRRFSRIECKSPLSRPAFIRLSRRLAGSAARPARSLAGPKQRARRMQRSRSLTKPASSSAPLASAVRANPAIDTSRIRARLGRSRSALGLRNEGRIRDGFPGAQWAPERLKSAHLGHLMTNGAANETIRRWQSSDGASDSSKPRLGGTGRGASSPGRLSCLGGLKKLPSRACVTLLTGPKPSRYRLSDRAAAANPLPASLLTSRRRRRRLAQRASQLPSLFTISLLARLSLFALPVRRASIRTHTARLGGNNNSSRLSAAPLKPARASRL